MVLTSGGGCDMGPAATAEAEVAEAAGAAAPDECGEEEEAPEDDAAEGGVAAEAPPPASSKSWSNSKEVLRKVVWLVCSSFTLIVVKIVRVSFPA